MADAKKHLHIISYIKSVFSFPRNKHTLCCAYVFMFSFVLFTVFLAFNPSPESSSPWFSNIFNGITSISRTGNSSSSSSPSVFSNGSTGSQFSSVISYFFPNSTQPSVGRSKNSTPSFQNQTKTGDPGDKVGNFSTNTAIGGSKSGNQTQKSDKVGNFSTNKTSIEGSKSGLLKNQTQSKDLGVVKSNQTAILAPKSPAVLNQSPNSAAKSTLEDKPVKEKGGATNLTSPSLSKGQGKESNSEREKLVEKLRNCDLFHGEWVRDHSYPLYKPGSCSLIDEQFNCYRNARPDKSFQQLKWKPQSCTLPRLNGSHMLELLRGKRLVFVGDSLNRNMWESLICILRNSVKDQSKVYESSGRQHFRSHASYSFIFQDYNCTVEFFVSPFLVQEWEEQEKNGSNKETLRLDKIGTAADKYKSADILIFNTGHWWTHPKTSQGRDYYQEGTHIYHELNVIEAFRKAVTTWARWVDANVNPLKTLVFFRGYSASHFKGGQWNSGGQCDHETEPIKNETYLAAYPPKMRVLEKVLRNMNTKVSFLNITRLTDYRKDGHPSIYRKQQLSDEEKNEPLKFQDCSHWCLPGVPDAWNELLYAELLVKQHEKQQQKNRWVKKQA